MLGAACEPALFPKEKEEDSKSKEIILKNISYFIWKDKKYIEKLFHRNNANCFMEEKKV